MQVALVGAGVMGTGMLEAIMTQVSPVMVFDPSREASDRARRFGAVVCSSLRELADSCDTVIVSVPGTAEVIEVVRGPGGILSCLKKGGLCIQTSTVDFSLSAELPGEFAARGLSFVDAPVSGRPPHLTVFASGDEVSVDKALAILSLIGDRIVRLGEGGAGSFVKLLNQFITYGCFCMTSEALLLAEAEGLDVAVVADALSGASASNAMIGAAVDGVRGAMSRNWGSVGLIKKDVGLVSKLFSEKAKGASSFLPPLEEVFNAASVEGSGHQPFPFAARALRSELFLR